MSSPLPPKAFKALLVSLERQGCTVKQVKAGYLVLFPDNKGSVTLHRTPSDHRAIMNMRSRIKRAGLEWPLDTHK